MIIIKNVGITPGHGSVDHGLPKVAPAASLRGDASGRKSFDAAFLVKCDMSRLMLNLA